MKKFFLLVFLSIGFGQIALSCDCLRAESFCETVAYSSPSYRVVHAVVTGKSAEQLDFKIKETLSGDYANGKHFFSKKGKSLILNASAVVRNIFST